MHNKNRTTERKNPFLGPQPFTRSDTIYGRERETEDLFNLLISGRIVLMYAASGAGKTSLIQAALIPRMIEEGFAVLDNLRVNIEPDGKMYQHEFLGPDDYMGKIEDLDTFAQAGAAFILLVLPAYKEQME